MRNKTEFKFNKKDVHYLAFEGGGGKGIAFLGAVQALSEKKILPIKPIPKDKGVKNPNQIKGISGSSAGAITALLLAVGYTVEDFKELFSSADTFDKFFDMPNGENGGIGICRSVKKKNIGYHNIAEKDVKKSFNIFFSNIFGKDYLKKSTFSWGFLKKVLAGLILLFVGFIRSKQIESNTILKKLYNNPYIFLYGLLYDGGLFLGKEVRLFLCKKVLSKLKDRIGDTNVAEMNFERFYEITGVDLVVTGSNLTTHKPAIFSKDASPTFPVVEAVAISMNIPVLFKPIYVDIGDSQYDGMWVDGGILNNFPLHAFDHLMPQISKKYPHLRPLNPHMFGLRLTDNPDDLDSKKNNKNSNSFFDNFLDFLGNLYNTVFYPSEEGQIRTKDEENQTVNLYVYNLSLLEFAPSETIRKKPVDQAYKKVKDKFIVENFMEG